MEKKYVVVTGAAGLIGSGIVRILNDRGEVPVVVDQLDHPEKIKNLQNKKFRELVAIEKLHGWLAGRESEIGAIIHMGACSDTLEQDGEFLYENNTVYTQRLAQYCLKHGVRFIYASSAATYGDGKEGFSDDHRGIEKLRPLNLYGASKQAFDLWALKEGVLGEVVGLKYFNVFGPNESHKGRMASMVYKMVPVIEKEGVIRLFKSSEPDRFADGGQCRDFIYVKDAARMTCDFLGDGRGGIFNVGMGTPTTWNALATAVFKALKKPVNIEYIEMPKDLATQYQNYTCAEMKKWGSKVRFDFTIESAVGDYVNQHLLLKKEW